MSYRRADMVLPEELIALIQQYVDGDYIYIPRREDDRRTWGQNTAIRKELEERNQAIFADHQKGMSISGLAEKYFLSEKSIQRIVYQKEKQHK